MAWEHAGSVSHGTLREADLIPALFAKLAEVDPEKAAELAKEYGYSRDLTESWFESTGPDARDDFMCDLDSALNEAAPMSHYFGANEGDASDFGFWPVSNTAN